MNPANRVNGYKTGASSTLVSNLRRNSFSNNRGAVSVGCAHADHRKTRIAMAQPEDRGDIYLMRHDVYARELRQHEVNQENLLSDSLDDFNQYITASIEGKLVGFISITPPGFNQYSIDKYISYDILPFRIDDGLYEIRILTVAKGYRSSRLALVLMYAAFRWIEEHNGNRVIAIGRTDVLSIYLKLGLQPLNQRIEAGAVTFELLTKKIAEIRSFVDCKHGLLDKLLLGIIWGMDIPYFKLARCFHGGAFFDEIGTSFDTLERKHSIVNADVLDAWFPPSPKVINTLSEHLPWLLNTSPPTASEGMRQEVAGARGVGAENILPGAGSSDLIYLAFLHWLKSDSRVLLLDPTYGEYHHILENVIRCKIQRLSLRRANKYAVDLEELEHLAKENFDLIVLVNPNSPTGRHIPRHNLEKTLLNVSQSTRIWIDETYVEYAGAGESLERFATRTPNIVVCKSMSKVYALSGVRAAYLCASRQHLSDLIPLTPPWAVSLPAQIAAIRALQDPVYYADRYQETHVLRNMLISNLRDIGVNEIIPGVANFVMCHLEPSGSAVASVVSECRTQGVFLRDVSSMGTDVGSRALRIAVKDKHSNRVIIETLDNVLNTVLSHQCRQRCR